MNLPTEAGQELIALEEAAVAVLRMLRRGVSHKHIAPSALIMIGLALLESMVSREAIATWLVSISQRYQQTVH